MTPHNPHERKEGEERVEVTVEVPSREPKPYSSYQHQREARSLSIQDGPTLALTRRGEIWLINSSYDKYIELSAREVLEILADIYDTELSQQ